MTSLINSMSKDEFTEIVLNSYSVREVVEKLGFSRNSGSMAIKVKERLAKDNIDHSHFKGRKAVGTKPVHKLDDILVKDSPYKNIHRLKIRLVNENRLKYECSICSNTGVWMGKPLTLQLDHIDGDNTNHEITNLRFLCPNCHSQTDTFAGRNSKRV